MRYYNSEIDQMMMAVVIGHFTKLVTSHHVRNFLSIISEVTYSHAYEI